MEKIIAIDLIIKVYIKRKFTVKSFISYILKHAIPTYFSTLNLQKLYVNEPDKTLFSMGTYERDDYYEIWNFSLEQVKEKIIFDFSKQRKLTKINVSNIWKSWQVINKTDKLKLLDKFWLAAKLTYYLNLIDDLEKIGPVAGKYCAFSSVHEHETILTLYFKKKGIPTYALQHGLYTVYNRDIPLDAILYENFISDYHLCWGQVTKDEYSSYGINNNALIVAGYARNAERPPVPKRLNKKRCLLLLARFTYHETNKSLLKILANISREEQISFYLKLHPSLYMAEFYSYYQKTAEENNWIISPQEATVDNLLKNGEFGWSISINTSAYYEAYIQYLPCLRYNDGSFENMADIMKDDFSSQKELLQRTEQIPFDDAYALENYCEEVDKKLNYAIGIDINNYHCLKTVD